MTLWMILYFLLCFTFIIFILFLFSTIISIFYENGFDEEFRNNQIEQALIEINANEPISRLAPFKIQTAFELD